MKLKKLNLIIILTLITGLLPSAAFAAERDPYELISAQSYDDSNAANKMYKRNGYLAMDARSHGSWIVFKNIEFTDAPYAVAVSNGVGDDYLANNSFVFKLDSPDSDPIATVYLEETLGWDNAFETVGTVMKSFTGVHDVYVSTNQPNNFFGFYFLARKEGETVYKPYDGENVFDDTKGNKNERAIGVLKSLGVAEAYENNSFLPELPITRAEFSKWLARLLNDEIPAPAESAFADISPDMTGYAEICTLYNDGIVKQNSEKKFNPYSFITVRDASVMILRALGYETLCDYKGGYPRGYDSMAASLGLSKAMAQNDILRRASAAALLYNMLDCDYAQIESIDSKAGISYVYKKGILEQKRNIYKKDGLVTVTSYSGLISGAFAADGSCCIDDETYKKGTANIDNYLGVKCEFLYKYDKASKTKTLIYAVPVKNAEQKFVSGINCKFSSITPNEISYTDENKKNKTIKISSKAVWLYNLSVTDVPITSMIKKPSEFKGRILFTDNGDGTQVVSVEEYQNVKLQSADVQSKIISDFISGNIYDFKDAKIIVSDGNEVVKLGKLPRDTIIEMYVSYDKNTVILMVNGTTVSGTAVSIDTDGNVLIGNTVYKCANEFSKDELKLGVESVFYLNGHNEIVYAKTNDSTKKVAIIDDISRENDIITITLITDTDTKTSFKTADKVYVDGVKCTDSDEIVSLFKRAERYTPMLYKTNSDGKITMLDTSVDNAKNENDTLTVFNPENLDGKTEFYYRGGLGVFENTSSFALPYPIKSDATVITRMSYSESGVNSKFMPVSKYSSHDGQPFVFYSFERDGFFVDLAYCRNFNYQTQGGYVVVDSVNTSVNANGDIGLSLNCLSGGVEVSYWISPQNTLNTELAKQLQKGDVIRPLLDMNSEVYKIEVACFADGRASAMIGTEKIGAGVNHDSGLSAATDFSRCLIYGTVKSVENNYVEIEAFQSNKKLVFYLGEKSVYRLSSAGELTYEPGITIRPSEKIFVRLYSGGSGLTVIYE